MRRVLFILLMNVAIIAVARTQSALIANLSKPIAVKSDAPLVTIALPANRTTGYSWFIGYYDKTLIQPVSHHYEVLQRNIPGAPGESIWTFRVLKKAFVVPHVMKIKMFYRRPWESENARTKMITIITR